jgi:glycerol-1-phosphate dehydrogenase [NAD(P)+]
LKITPNKEKALAYANEFEYKVWAEELRKLLGLGAEAMIALETKERKYSVAKHEKRLEIILEKWDKIQEIIREEIPTQQEIENILHKIGAPKTAQEIGIDCDLSITLKATKDIRDKYVLSRLLWDLGVIEEKEFSL